MLGLRAARVFDGERSVAGGALLLLDGDTVAGVWPHDAPAPEGCEVLDVGTGTVLPGLVDAHVHLCGDGQEGALDRLADDDLELPAVVEAGLRRHLDNGVTAVRDLGDRRYAVLDWRASTGRAGGWPTVVAAGPPITSPRGHCWNMGGEAAGADQLRAAVRERVERGADLVEIMVSGGFATPGTEVMGCQFSTEDVRLVVAEAHRAGVPVTAHAHGLPAVELAMAVGADGIEHCSFLTDRGVAMREDHLAVLAERRTVVCPTLGLVGELRPPAAMVAMFERLGMTMEQARLARCQQMVRMHEAGVVVVSGSDGGIGPPKPHGIVAESVADLVHGGLPASAALASATSLAAQACGVGDRTGRLQTGYAADVLVVDGDPLTDITALRAVRAVWVRGQRHQPQPDPSTAG